MRTRFVALLAIAAFTLSCKSSLPDGVACDDALQTLIGRHLTQFCKVKAFKDPYRPEGLTFLYEELAVVDSKPRKDRPYRLSMLVVVDSSRVLLNGEAVPLSALKQAFVRAKAQESREGEGRRRRSPFSAGLYIKADVPMWRVSMVLQALAPEAQSVILAFSPPKERLQLPPLPDQAAINRHFTALYKDIEGELADRSKPRRPREETLMYRMSKSVNDSCPDLRELYVNTFSAKSGGWTVCEKIADGLPSAYRSCDCDADFASMIAVAKSLIHPETGMYVVHIKVKLDPAAKQPIRVASDLPWSKVAPLVLDKEKQALWLVVESAKPK